MDSVSLKELFDKLQLGVAKFHLPGVSPLYPFTVDQLKVFLNVILRALAKAAVASPAEAETVIDGMAMTAATTLLPAAAPVVSALAPHIGKLIVSLISQFASGQSFADAVQSLATQTN